MLLVQKTDFNKKLPKFVFDPTSLFEAKAKA